MLRSEFRLLAVSNELALNRDYPLSALAVEHTLELGDFSGEFLGRGSQLRVRRGQLSDDFVFSIATHGSVWIIP